MFRTAQELRPEWPKIETKTDSESGVLGDPHQLRGLESPRCKGILWTS